MFFTEGRRSDRSGVGLTGSYETPLIDQAEVRTKCANSILVRLPDKRGVENQFVETKLDFLSILGTNAFSRIQNAYPTRGAPAQKPCIFRVTRTSREYTFLTRSTTL